MWLTYVVKWMCLPYMPIENIAAWQGVRYLVRKFSDELVFRLLYTCVLHCSSHLLPNISSALLSVSPAAFNHIISLWVCLICHIIQGWCFDPFCPQSVLGQDTEPWVAINASLHCLCEWVNEILGYCKVLCLLR